MSQNRDINVLGKAAKFRDDAANIFILFLNWSVKGRKNETCVKKALKPTKKEKWKETGPL
jgi:hypothetical protein